MASRRLARVPEKVIHWHRIGSRVFRRVSELVYVRGQPKAILRWIDSAGVRAPLYVDLNPANLRRLRSAHATFQYDGTTVDPADTQIITGVVQNPG